MNRETHLTIDCLVLHGFAPAQRNAVVAGFRAELARLLTASDAGTDFGQSRVVPALKVSRRHYGGTAAGEAAARQLLQGLRR